MENQIVLTREEEIENMYRYKGWHKECKEGIYSKGEEDLRKLYPGITGLEFVYDHINHISCGFYEIGYELGCDNCIELWKRDQPILRDKLQETL